MEGLAADDVVGKGGDELRDKSAEGFGIFAMRQTVTFQGAGDEGLIDRRLIAGGYLNRLAIIRNHLGGQKSIGRRMRRDRLSLRGRGIQFVRKNDLPGGSRPAMPPEKRLATATMF